MTLCPAGNSNPRSCCTSAGSARPPDSIASKEEDAALRIYKHPRRFAGGLLLRCLRWLRRLLLLTLLLWLRGLLLLLIVAAAAAATAAAGVLAL